MEKNISSIFSSNEVLEHQIKKFYIKYLNAKSTSNLTVDFLEYMNSNSFFSKFLSIDKEKVEDIIKKEKNKICVKCCNKDFKEAYFEFYCGCKICKEECFINYIKPDEDDENKIYYDYFTKCPCGEEFNKKYKLNIFKQ
jgi:hypothetical protein